MRHLMCTILAASGGLVLTVPAHAQDAGAVSNQLVVGFRDDPSAERERAIVERAGGTVRRRLRAIDAVTIRPRSGISLGRLRDRLEASSDVRYVERDFILSATATPNDPGFVQQYGLHQPTDADVDAPEGWDVRRSCGKVAVLDSGVDTDHPDLRPNLWVNSGEKPDNGKDDDDNGYVDDHVGWDARAEEGSAEDQNGHGTHVSGIVGAVGDNSTGVAGVCWKATIVAVKFMDARGRGSTSDATAGIEYAVRRGAKVINCSFGSSSDSEALADAISYAKEKGVLLVVAAGNEGEDIDREPVYPASYGHGNIVTVAATTPTDGLASFSNYGDDAVDVAAPGDNIYSTYLSGRYETLDGTSMAAPAVAGAASLLRQQEPEASYSAIRTALRQKGVDKPPSLAGKVVYGGRLNLRRALDYLGTL